MNIIRVDANLQLYVLVLNAMAGIKAVAPVNYHGGEVFDWGAYIGAGDEIDVAHHGEKMYKSWALAMFPSLPPDLYRE